MKSLLSWIKQSFYIVFLPSSFFRSLEDGNTYDLSAEHFSKISGVIEAILFLTAIIAGYTTTIYFYPSILVLLAIVTLGLSFALFIRFRNPLGFTRYFYRSFEGEKDMEDILLYSSGLNAMTSWIPVALFFFFSINQPKEALGVTMGVMPPEVSAFIFIFMAAMFFSPHLGLEPSTPQFVWYVLLPSALLSVFPYFQVLSMNGFWLILLSALIISLYQFYIQYIGFTTLSGLGRGETIKKLAKSAHFILMPLDIVFDRRKNP